MAHEVNSFRIKLTKDGVKVLSTNEKSNKNHQPINILSTNTNSSSFTLRKQCFREFDGFFDDFLCEILNVCDTEKQMNTSFLLCSKLVESTQKLGKSMLEEEFNRLELEKIEPIMKKCFDYVHQKLDSYKTTKRRLREFKNNPMFVEPEELVLDMKWRAKRAANRNIPDHKLVPTTFQYVPPLKTIKCLFSKKEFSEKYFTYNNNRMCKPGVYENFCDGSVFKNNELFQLFPDSLQLELSIDDFEAASGMKSKATVHKVCGIYLRIRNMPPDINSKLKSINLLALCETAHLKSSESTINCLLERFVKEIIQLETVGIEVLPGKFLRGTLISTSQDNLGANGLFGFVECFIVDDCCRFCVCNQEERQTTFTEQADKMRTKESYAHSVSQLDEDSDKHVDGIKRYCILNDLKFYHMIENTSLDLMHDVNEGVVPFFVKFLFNKLMASGINLTTIQVKVRDYNYGTLNSCNKPSIIKLASANLNQNASQIVCIMRYLPFIFFKERNLIGETWMMIIELLKIMQILYSCSIGENYVIELERLISKHLGDLIANGQKLIFKHHNLIHYPNNIRRNGPVIHNSMMRYEAKHKVFTHRAHTTNNFINIAKTLAYSHQESMCLGNICSSDFNPSKTIKNIKDSSEYTKHRDLLRDRSADDLFILEFLHYNSFEYRQGLLVLNCQNVFMINLVLHDTKENIFFLLCDPIEVCGFEELVNSYKISKTQSQNAHLIPIQNLQIKETFNPIYVDKQMYIFAKDLNFVDLH